MYKYRLTIENLPLTWREKISDKYVKLFAIPLIPIFIALMPIFILAMLVGLFYENTIEKYFYKIIGKKRSPPKEKNPYPNLPIFLSIKSMWDIDGIEDKMKNEYGLSQKELGSIDFIQINSSRHIEGLQDYFFNREIIIFNNDVFLNKVSLPDYNWSLCYIEVKKLKFYEFPNSDVKFNRKHTETVDTLTIRIREYLKKQIVTIKCNNKQRADDRWTEASGSN